MAAPATAVAKFEVGDQSPIVDDLIGSGADQLLARKYTLVSGQNVVRGTLLGVITSGGKVNKSLSGASDGSQTPFGIAAVDANATAGDVEILVYTRGTFNENAVTYGTAHTASSVREGLRDKGIYLETPVKRYP